MKENELQVQKYTWAIIFNFKARYRLIFVVSSKTKKENQQQREIKFFIKESQEFYDAISAVVCLKSKYNIFITLKYKAHREVAPFLL